MADQKLAQLALTFLPRIGDISLKSLISYCGSAEKIFTTTKGKLEKVPGIGSHASKSILDHKQAFLKAEKALHYCQNNNISLLFYTDKDYPSFLKQLPDSPSIIYLKGNVLPEKRRYISIVGTRKASKEGKQNVAEIIKDLAPYNPIIISGLAYGIDIEAHNEALANGLATYGVMATGIEKVYPAIHTKLAGKMIENGGLLTEYAPHTKTDPSKFPARNRIIAGLSEATLVVEAGKKGGALITAYLARDYDREVFAIPGNLKNENTVGCNNIIKNNIAQLVSSGKDIAFYLGWETTNETASKNPTELIEQDYNPEEWVILQLLGDSELHVDEISWKSQIQIGKLASILLNLEFKNIIVALPGKKYRIK
ncbi:MAG: DNA-processing protein DprA [Cyclobacteriaceae bacterium]|nr:DNA-processing protein DprA [Cyclobacteriaceae bacterium]